MTIGYTDSWGPGNWISLAAGVSASAGLILTIAKVGISAVKSATEVTQSVDTLNTSLQRLETRLTDYIRAESVADIGMQEWRRDIEARVGVMEGRIDSWQPRRRRVQ